MKDAYYASRYKPDPARTSVWREIVRYEQRLIPENATVVDLGAGYCDFINNIKAVKKYAVDTSPELKDFAAPGIETVNGIAWSMPSVKDSSVDVVHASNLFEHFTDDELAKTMAEVKRVLKPGGQLILMQPNYRLQAANYFDDPTHKKVFSDAALESFLLMYGMEIVLKKPRFLPFSMKSRGVVPPMPWLVRLYINSPWKPFAGQMLFISKKK